ncbi:hypothetical protein OCT51_16395 [Halomonas sp. LR3S48]|uniref:hypothetical protein n=1 Tax=Halomonas sp. LR3S48 TaxID=2982694 RepID=UPI0021E3680D|nr:hypothetical protein [Halomonas sp. LR3S48]UYG02750.1 hypothetical protein OCT51_16395 [Halomonas sp. LR3S48]
MLAFLRLALTFVVILALLYNALSLYLRLRYRAELGRHLDTQQADGDRTALFREGMKRYDRSWQRKLVRLVYVLPPSVILLIIYVINFM